MTYLMTPGAFELTEQAAHLVGHGDTAHADDGHAGDDPADEHGCSGPYHFCTCHQSVTFVTGAAHIAAISFAPAGVVAESGSASAVDSGYAHQVYRPPQA